MLGSAEVEMSLKDNDNEGPAEHEGITIELPGPTMSVNMPKSAASSFASSVLPHHAHTKMGRAMSMTGTEIKVGEEVPIGVDDVAAQSAMRETFLDEEAKKRNLKCPRYITCKGVGTLLGLTISLVILCIPLDKNNSKVQKTFAVLLAMATCWMTEVLPLAITALLPVVLFPLMGVMSAGVTAGTYFNDTIFVFLSGFLMALGMEHWKLHMRIALGITKIFASPKTVLFGIMFATWFLSMWISNTACAIMMIANATALVDAMEGKYGKDKMKGFSDAVFLGIAFSANIGGFATLIGTPPNMIFSELFKQIYQDVVVDNVTSHVTEISFSTWIISFLPLSFIMLILLWAGFVIVYLPKKLEVDKQYFVDQYKALGSMKYEEIVVGVGFIILAMLWLFRADLVFGDFTIKGWANIFPEPKYISDGTCGMFIALCLFMIPTRAYFNDKVGRDPDTGHYNIPFIMTWETAKTLPWDLVLLFGGGFALAEACKTSGLSLWLGNQLSAVGDLPKFFVVLIFVLFMTLLTNFTSNTASTSIILPVIASVASASHIHPLLVMIPVTLAASCAFIMPVGTPPNLAVFASKRITIAAMAKCGLCVSAMSVLLIVAHGFSLLPAVFNFKIGDFPPWAEPSN